MIHLALKRESRCACLAVEDVVLENGRARRCR